MASATFGLGGFGLLIAPVCPCRAIVTAENELVIAHGDRAIARFTPKERAAVAGAPTWHTPAFAQFGEGGPTLSIAEPLRFEDVFLQVDAGLGESPWCALGPGFVHDLPAGVFLLSAAPEDDDPLYELHLAGGDQEFIRFQRQPRPASAVEFHAGPSQQLLTQDFLKVQEADGSIRKLGFTEVGYEHDGASWKQLMLAAPLGETTSLIVSAQARADHADTLFQIAAQVAATLGALG